VSRLTKGTINKRGQATALRLEAEATRCVALHTSIPVPTVYDFWTKDGGRACLVMEYEDDDTVQRNWRHLSVDQKMAVMRVLRALMSYIICTNPIRKERLVRSLERRFLNFVSPGSPWMDHSERRLRITIGVFPHSASLENNTLLPSCHYSNCETRWGMTTRSSSLVVAILDWEQAGWHPEYWETVKFTFGNQSASEWAILGRQEIFHGYDLELERENELLLIFGPPR